MEQVKPDVLNSKTGSSSPGSVSPTNKTDNAMELKASQIASQTCDELPTVNQNINIYSGDLTIPKENNCLTEKERQKEEHMNIENKVLEFPSDNNKFDSIMPSNNSEPNNKINVMMDNGASMPIKDLSHDICTDKSVINKDNTSNLYCSTPVVSKEIHHKETKEMLDADGDDFGRMSPLNTVSAKTKINLKRKNLGLECIAEVNEDEPELYEGKKLKLTDNADNHGYSKTDDADDDGYTKTGNEQDDSLYLEAPAKSILKKWQLSSSCRSSGATYLVLDECGESNAEDNTKINQEVADTAVPDDFEVACESLNEELMKSFSNIETLEKYYSQVQLENQMDDVKFDEILQELTMNYEFDEKSALTAKQSEDYIPSNKLVNTEVNNVTSCTQKTSSCEDKLISEANTKPTSVKLGDADSSAKLSENRNDSNIKETLNNTDHNNVNMDISNITLTVKVKEDIHPETSKLSETRTVTSNTSISEPSSGRTTKAENLSIVYADNKDMTMDEEDVLLEEDVSTKKKPYVFFEFVSSDPKENEDNYNPEWQKLGRLTSDEERYKAVRDRWRSLVPPEPNRDLTCRQWREKNNKPPLNLPSLNNNHMHEDTERNQLCTAVFEMKIKRMVQELEDHRQSIINKRNEDFENLALAQDEEQRRLALGRRGSRPTGMDLSSMRKRHIEECRNLKKKHDLRSKEITRQAEDKINILKDASDEVLLFQKFYKGVGAHDDEVCLYMTDTQVQELMETEDMLEQYATFYK